MNRLGLISIVMTASLLVGCAAGSHGGSQKELATISDQTDSHKRAMNHLNLAISYYQQHQWKSALDDIKQTLQSEPNMADAYGVRGLIYMELNEPKLAEESFLQALKLAPNSPDFSNNYGWFLCQNGRVSQSIPYFEAAINSRNYQSPAKALNNAGVCSVKLKNEVAAERYFAKAFQYDPNNPVTNINLSNIYYDRKDYERARFYLARVPKADELNADVLWLAIKVHHKLGDRDAEISLITQLRRRHPDSPEYAAFKRGAFDE